MALWRARTLTFEQQAKLEEDHLFRGDKSPQIENMDSVSCGEDNKLSKCFQTDVPLQVSSFFTYICAYTSKFYVANVDKLTNPNVKIYSLDTLLRTELYGII